MTKTQIDQAIVHHPAARRVVLLGASNIARAFPHVMETTYRLLGRPLDVLAAFGRGRSYGEPRSMLGRTLPGIIECGLWQALRLRPSAATFALVTDVGNDLLYEATVAQILQWVEKCVERLQTRQTRIVLTPLPLCSITRTSALRFRLLRNVLFPGCRLTHAAMLERAFDLDRGLRDLASARGLVLAEHQPQWYGFDRIHIRRRQWFAAWDHILKLWLDVPPAQRTTARLPWSWGALRLRLLAPERRWLFGREQRQAQPAERFPDGTTLALY